MLSSRILSSAMQRCGNRMVVKAASSLHLARSINTDAAGVAARTSLQPPITTKYQLIGSTSSFYNGVTTVQRRYKSGKRRYKSASDFNVFDLIEVTYNKSKHYGRKGIVHKVGSSKLTVECLDDLEDGPKKRVRICDAKKILRLPRWAVPFILKVKGMVNGQSRKAK